MEVGLNQKELKLMYDRGIINHGNIARFMAVMNKAISGNEITVGFIGGSITAGSLADIPEKSYAHLTYSWWKSKFPKSKINYINAGVGATTSQFGVARLDEDLLRWNPDVIFVEFSVNDTETELYKETYEGLVRRCLMHRTIPALFIINNVFYSDGHNSQSIHNEVGIYYSLPIVSMKESIYSEIRKGTLSSESITPDMLHPNNMGHELVARVIINHLENIYSDFLKYNSTNIIHKIPANPLTNNRFSKAIRYNNETIQPQLEGFISDTESSSGSWDVFRKGWYGYSIGESIRFLLEGSIISIQYRKYAEHPAPRAVAIIDKDEEHPIILDANFNETWGDCLYLQDLITENYNGSHELEIRIIEEAGEKTFYLASVIIA